MLFTFILSSGFIWSTHDYMVLRDFKERILAYREEIANDVSATAK